MRLCDVTLKFVSVKIFYQPGCCKNIRVAHICIVQRRYNIWEKFFFIWVSLYRVCSVLKNYCVYFLAIVVWKRIRSDLKWHPNICLIIVSIGPIDHTLIKTLFQFYYSNFEKVQVKYETEVIKKERQMVTEDVFSKWMLLTKLFWFHDFKQNFKEAHVY